MSKVWVVTGASQGLGLGIVKYLLENGESVCATTRNVNSLIEKVGPESDHFFPYSVDLAKEESVNDFKEKVLEKFSTVDVLVNNAGYEMAGPIEYLKKEQVESIFDINVFGVLNMIRSFVPVMREKRSGCVVNIMSSSGFRAHAMSAAYCATKSAVLALSKSLRLEMEPFGVRVVGILPGGMITNFAQSIRFVQETNEDYEYVREYLSSHRLYPPGPKNARVENVAKLIQMCVEADNPPTDFWMGSDCRRHAREEMNYREEEFAKYKAFCSLADRD